MSDYKRLTKLNGEPKTIFNFSGSMQDFKIYKRLQELEDKIENGTLVELKEIELELVSTRYNQKTYRCANCGNERVTRFEIYDNFCPVCGVKFKRLKELKGEENE